MVIINDIAAYLVDNGIGSLGKDLFITGIPDDSIAASVPDAVVGLTMTGGSGSSMAERTRRVTIQIVVRSGRSGKSGATETDHTNAMAKADEIRHLLHADDESLATNLVMNKNIVVMTTRAIQEPFDLVKDNKGRYLIDANYELLVVNS